jgi:hypothetical protein
MKEWAFTNQSSIEKIKTTQYEVGESVACGTL